MTPDEAYKTACEPFACPICGSEPMRVHQTITTLLSLRGPKHDRLEDRHLIWDCTNPACGWKEVGPPIK